MRPLVLVRLLLFSFFLFVFEFAIFPGAVDEGSNGSIAGIKNDFVAVWAEAGVLQVAAGGLQRIENEARSFVVDLLRKQEAENFLKSHLDGVGVFKNGKNAGARAAGAVGGKADALIVKALVKETETVAAQGGRSALHAVDFDVLTAIRVSGHFGSYPLPL